MEILLISSAEAAETDLTSGKSYATLISFGGNRSLRHHVQARYNDRRSVAGACAAMASPLVELLDKGHYKVRLGDEERRRLIIWMDTYALRSGSHSPDQERHLRELRDRMAARLIPPH